MPRLRCFVPQSARSGGGDALPRQSREQDEAATVALAEANEQMLQYSEDAEAAHESMMTALAENEKLAAALATYDEAMPAQR